MSGVVRGASEKRGFPYPLDCGLVQAIVKSIWQKGKLLTLAVIALLATAFFVIKQTHETRTLSLEKVQLYGKEQILDLNFTNLNAENTHFSKEEEIKRRANQLRMQSIQE